MTENEFLRELVAALMKQNAELLAQVASANVSVQYPVISRRFIAEKSVFYTQKGTDFSLRSK